MLRWAFFFAVIALVAAMLGFTGIAGTFAGIAKVLFGIFVAIFLAFLIAGILVGRRIR